GAFRAGRARRLARRRDRARERCKWRRGGRDGAVGESPGRNRRGVGRLGSEGGNRARERRGPRRAHRRAGLARKLPQAGLLRGGKVETSRHGDLSDGAVPRRLESGARPPGGGQGPAEDARGQLKTPSAAYVCCRTETERPSL